MLFEHLVFNQIVHSAWAKDRELRISSYRTEHGAEVDFIVEMGDDVIALEVKASANVGLGDLRGLHSFADYYRKPHRAFIASLSKVPRAIGKVRVLPWQMLLKELGL